MFLFTENESGSFYVSVDQNPNEHTDIVHNLLAYFIGDRNPVGKKEDCKRDDSQQVLFQTKFLVTPALQIKCLSKKEQENILRIQNVLV